MKKIDRIPVHAYEALSRTASPACIISPEVCMVKIKDLVELELDVEVLNCGIRERDEIIDKLKEEIKKKINRENELVEQCNNLSRRSGNRGWIC